ncbi:MAG: ELM1/GtrOC1 family putative glycosyltransferase [bacterium]|nr:ELM1/GtrOC1 family putative glycosyltransferase [bacterium]
MPARGATPQVWILLGPKQGDNAQLRALAQLLTWPCTEKQLVFNRLAALPNIFLGAGLHSSKNGASLLRPPWPDLVITIGRRGVPAARWVQKQSGGRSKLVHLGRPWGPLHWFDLIVTTPQYGLPKRENVLHNSLPISSQSKLSNQCSQRSSQTQHDCRDTAVWLDRFSTLPRPWIALLSGGTSRPYVFDKETGTALGRAASAFAQAQGGSLLLTAGRRCPAVSFTALSAAIKACGCPSYIHNPHNPHESGQDNPYAAYLALADRFIVTSDSVSMAADACLSGKPVSVYELPLHYDLRMRAARWFRAQAMEKQGNFGSLIRKLYAFLVEYGLLTSTRDERIFMEMLRKNGKIATLGEEGTSPERLCSNQQELENTLARIRALFTHTG